MCHESAVTLVWARKNASSDDLHKERGASALDPLVHVELGFGDRQTVHIG
jgi:hypothetical protein